MTKHGKTISAKNGFKLIEIEQIASDGSISIIGYAIIGPNGIEVSHFSSIEEALEKFKELTDVTPPSSPPPPPKVPGKPRR